MNNRIFLGILRVFLGFSGFSMESEGFPGNWRIFLGIPGFSQEELGSGAAAAPFFPVFPAGIPRGIAANPGIVAAGSSGCVRIPGIPFP